MHRTQGAPGLVKDGQIVLNVGPSAVRNIHMDNDWVTFSARFGGISHDIEIPVGNVLAIYAKETGEGMSFEHLLPNPDHESGETETEAVKTPGEPEPPSPPRGKPQLRVVK
jgi:stringent starvation protein B